MLCYDSLLVLVTVWQWSDGREGEEGKKKVRDWRLDEEDGGECEHIPMFVSFICPSTE